MTYFGAGLLERSIDALIVSRISGTKENIFTSSNNKSPGRGFCVWSDAAGSLLEGIDKSNTM